MNTITDKAIVLKRVEYGEADRIITFLTKENGRIDTIAKGCRKAKSKLAGGVEPLNVNELTWIQSKGEGLNIVRSARCNQIFGNLLKDYDVLKVSYDLLGLAEKITRHHTDDSIFDIVVIMFDELNNEQNSLLVEVWFKLQLLKLTGHQVDLTKDAEDKNLESYCKYVFDSEAGGLRQSMHGRIAVDHIKVLRLLHEIPPSQAAKIAGIDELTAELLQPVREMYEYYL